MLFVRGKQLSSKENEEQGPPSSGAIGDDTQNIWQPSSLGTSRAEQTSSLGAAPGGAELRVGSGAKETAPPLRGARPDLAPLRARAPESSPDATSLHLVWTLKPGCRRM